MNFDNTYAKLPINFFAEVSAQEFSNPSLLAFNKDLAEELGLDLKDMSPEELALVFSGQTLLEGSQPLSMVYAAHQFGNFVPQLGDGRAMLLGEVVNPQGKRFDVQLKGSGPTPFSRNGDGLSALGPVIREYIVSEAMYHLGVPATRSLAAVNTGDYVYRREGELPGGVFTRVAASHIRIGTFQYFANKGNLEALIALLDFSIAQHYPEINEQIKESNEALNPALMFLKSVAKAQVSLVAKWMSLGFIHGVMNTDNTTVSGETIDFGPCAFMDNYYSNKVFSSIDSNGRYSYTNQTSIVGWNLCRLADCLIPLMSKDRDDAVKLLNSELSQIGALFKQEWLQIMSAKFGLVAKSEDEKLINSFLDYMEEEQLDFTLSFRNLTEVLDGKESEHFHETESFKKIKENWFSRLKEEDLTNKQVIEKMNKSNPLYIPRNHQVERAIEKANDGDLSVFHEMNKVLKQPFTYQEELDQYSVPPEPEQEVKATFCGT